MERHLFEPKGYPFLYVFLLQEKHNHKKNPGRGTAPIALPNYTPVSSYREYIFDVYTIEDNWTFRVTSQSVQPDYGPFALA